MNDHIVFYLRKKNMRINTKLKSSISYGNHANKLIRKIIDIMVPPLPCTWQIMNMFILSNGKVCHCCGDSEGEFIVGDVKRMNLINIWKSNLNKSLRYKHLYGTHTRDIEICKRCIRSPVKL